MMLPAQPPPSSFFSSRHFGGCQGHLIFTLHRSPFSLPSPQQSQPQQPRALPVCASAKGQRQRYTLPPIYVSRADLGWGQPPWKFHQTCTAEELQLQRQVPALGGNSDIEVKFTVEAPNGAAGLWVKGEVSVPALQLQCEWCGEAYSPPQPVRTRLSVWLNGEAASDADLVGCEELAFPESEDVCDLSVAVADAISLALPSVCLCGGGRCSRLGSQPDRSSGAAAAGPSPFAALLRGGGGGKKAGKAKRGSSKVQ